MAPSALVVLVLGTIPAHAQTGDAWTQARGGPEQRGWLASGPEPPFAEAWSVEEALGGPAGTSGLSPVAVADGLVVTVAPEAVLAVDAASGAERWRIDRAGGPPIAPAIVGEGRDAVVVFVEGFGPNPPGADATATATPAPAEDADAGGEVALVAVGFADGDERWRVDLPGPSRSGVVADDAAVYVGGNDGSVTAVDAAQGELLWTQPVGGSVLGSPAIAGERVLVAASGDTESALVIAALEAGDGAIAWRAEPAAASLVGGVAVADELAYVALDDRTVRAIEIGSGRERWSARLNWIVSPLSAPAVAADHVVVVDLAGQVYALDRRTGDRLWDHALLEGVIRSAPVVSGSIVAVPTVSGELFALDLGSGDVVFTLDAAAGVLRSLAVTDERLIAVRGGEGAGLVAFEPDPDGELVRIASPTITDPGALAANAAIALVPFVVVLLLLGRALAGRWRPLPVAAAADPHDPIEDGPPPPEGSA